jgi:hypothetical protein
MKKSEFKWVFFGCIYLAGLLFILSSCQNSGTDQAQSEIDKIAAKWVPDSRVGVCSVVLKTGRKDTAILSGETTIAAAKVEIIKALNNRYKYLIDSIIMLPDTLRNKNFMGVATLSVINLRKEPDHSSELVSQALLGTPVLILKEAGSWLMIQTPDNYISWTEASSIMMMNRIEIEKWRNAPRVIYQDNTGWLYDTTSLNSGVVGDLAGGCIMEKTGELNGFVSVMLPDRRRGYVEKQKVMDFEGWKESAQCTEESICKTSLTFMGIPYLWGGTSPKGADCSGFVKSVFFRNGLILQRDASLQALHGLNVDISDGYNRLKKGDLLFFGSRVNNLPHVTHVAIYLGNKEYINSSGRVMINSLDSTRTNFVSYRLSSLLSAKRIIGVQNDPGIMPVVKHPWY